MVVGKEAVCKPAEVDKEAVHKSVAGREEVCKAVEDCISEAVRMSVEDCMSEAVCK